MHIRVFDEKDTAAVVALWRAAGLTRPWNDPYADIRRKQQEQPDLFFVAEVADDLVGVILAGYDGHRGWIHYFAVSPDHRREGIGRALLSHAEQALARRGCAKVQLQVRPDNLAVLDFYEAAGYEPYEAINLGRRLEVD
ncbi:GNAT family acetyltransferase [Frigoribacterium sp. 2-23]|uniref:GNAT family acetyltransferase n=1 Tax=Frigoribacterium sp. 2-23 TaxID=3415006 RepID=UPI003C6F34E7